MGIHKTKTLEDFPKFLVAAVRRFSRSDLGYIQFEIDGTFDHSIQKVESWFWLLSAEGRYLCASLQSLDEETRTATLTCELKEEPTIAGETLAFLSSYWQGYHVSMILQEDAQWEEVVFHATDAVQESFTEKDGRHFRKLSRMQRGQELPAGAQIVTDGWDHEHCELCNKHIDPPDHAWTNKDGFWVCLSCFERYVKPKDLSFVDEL
jgi:hypothetical protein